MILGKNKLAKILSRMGIADAKKILASIKIENGKLADEIRELMFSFEDVLNLSEKEMEEVHQKIDKKDLLLAMKGASEELKEKLLTGMSAKRREMFTEDLELMGKVKRKDVEAAQQRIADVLREMIEKGELSLDDEWVE